MTHALTLITRLERQQIPASGGNVHLLIQVAAPAQPAGDRLPLNLAAVVDRSGSMEGPKLERTKQALGFLVDHLGGEDRLAIVAYDDQVTVPFSMQPVGNKDLLKAQIAQILSGGSTNLSGGLATGMQQLGTGSGERVRRVLLMTDGLANCGVTDPPTLVSWAKGWRKRGLTMSTLGVGDDFNEDLLVAMAEAGGGSFYYLQNPDMLPSIFATELEGLLQVAGQGLSLTVQSEPGVAIAEVIGYPPTGTPSCLSMSLPDIYAGETKSVLLTLAVAAPPPSGSPLLRIRLDYLPTVAGGEPERLEAEVAAEATSDPALLASPPDPEVARQLALARAAQAQEEAVRLSDQGALFAGATVLAEAAAPLRTRAAGGDAEARERLEQLEHQAFLLREEQYSAGLRKQMRQESHRSRSGRRPT